MGSKALGVCAIFKNESNYLEEWLEFHIAQGVECFYLFNDKSSDAYEEVLRPYISSGKVSLFTAPAEPDMTLRQEIAYSQGLRAAKWQCRWLAFIDMDEFLFAPGRKISEILPRSPLVAGVFVWWRMFGSSGQAVPPPGGILRNFTMASPFPKTHSETRELRRLGNSYLGAGANRVIHGRLIQGKCLVKPLWIREIANHFPRKYFGIMVDEHNSGVSERFPVSAIRRHFYPQSWSLAAKIPTVDKIRINHYWSKSLAELRRKSEKWSQVKTAATFEDYLRWDAELNNSEDLTILRQL
jgi:hypothetical protein